MTSTEFNVGLGGSKSSSRVLKPPGGGHSNIFGGAEAKPINPRPKYDQQNSSNLNFCMNTTDPNLKVEKTRPNVEEVVGVKPAPSIEANNSAPPPSAPEPVVQKPAPEPAPVSARVSAPAPKPAPTSAPEPVAAQPQSQGRSRVPPGGFSSGLW